MERIRRITFSLCIRNCRITLQRENYVRVIKDVCVELFIYLLTYLYIIHSLVKTAISLTWQIKQGYSSIRCGCHALV